MIIEYDPKRGRPISDGAVEHELNWILSDDGADDSYLHLIYSTANIFAAVRLAIAQDRIAPKSITFQYKDKQFQANTYGAILDWPIGFCDFEGRMAEQIIRTATEKRKKHKEQHS